MVGVETAIRRTRMGSHKNVLIMQPSFQVTDSAFSWVVMSWTCCVNGSSTVKDLLLYHTVYCCGFGLIIIFFVFPSFIGDMTKNLSKRHTAYWKRWTAAMHCARRSEWKRWMTNSVFVSHHTNCSAFILRQKNLARENNGCTVELINCHRSNFSYCMMVDGNKLWILVKCSRVCSVHFVDSKPWKYVQV